MSVVHPVNTHSHAVTVITDCDHTHRLLSCTYTHTYLNRFHIRRTNECRCGQEQSVNHLLFECQLLESIREPFTEFCQSGDATESVLEKIFEHDSAGLSLVEVFDRIHQKLIEWEKDMP